MSTTTEPTTDYEAKRQRDNANAFRRMWEWAENVGAIGHIYMISVSGGGGIIQLSGLEAMKRFLPEYIATWITSDKMRTYRIRHGGGFEIIACEECVPSETHGTVQL